MNRSSAVDDLINCPICFMVPAKEIFQCVDGHWVCSTCVRSLHDCPQCRKPYGHNRIRNRALEDLLDTMLNDCFYKNKGCPRELKRGELNAHVASCEFRPIYFCKMIGFSNCEFEAPRIPQLAIAHLKQIHGISVVSGNELAIAHKDLIVPHRNTRNAVTYKLTDKTRWNPILWNPDKDDYGPTFLLLSLVHNPINPNLNHNRPSSCSWICLYMGDSAEEAAKFQVTYSIPNVFGNDPGLALQWDSNVLTFRALERVLMAPPHPIQLRILNDFLKEMERRTNRNCDLLVKAKIMNMKKGNPENNAQSVPQPNVIVKPM